MASRTAGIRDWGLGFGLSRPQTLNPKPQTLPLERQAGLSDAGAQAVREVKVGNTEGLHARPVMRFIDVASRFQSKVTVANVSRRGEKVDGKSAMQMMLLEATQGCVLRIEACGADAAAAVEALAALIESGFHLTPPPQTQ